MEALLRQCWVASMMLSLYWMGMLWPAKGTWIWGLDSGVGVGSVSQ